jgi:hypothetical protein
MKRIVAGRRFLLAAALMALVAVPAILVAPRDARAFTIPSLIIFYDAISVPIDHTLHVNIVNEFGASPVGVRAFVRPTTPGAGSPVVGASIGLNPGQGSDEAFPFAGFSPPAGGNRVPVVTTIMVNTGLGTTPVVDWSGKLATSLEIVEDSTGRVTAILGGRHIVTPPGLLGLPPTFCLSCN